MTLTHYVLLPLVFLSQLVLHSAQEFKQTRGCSSFRCGKLGEVGFPFSNTTNPACGLCRLNCTGPEPKVQCHEHGRWHKVHYLNFSTQTIEINFRLVPTKVLEPNGCRLVRNFTFEASPSFSINVTESHQIIKCKKHKPHPEFSHEFRNYSGCKDYDLYFYDDQEKCLPTVYETPSSSCLVVYLPSTSLQSLQSCLADNLTSPWDGIFSINWRLLPACSKCHLKGGQCLSRPDRTFKCGNLKKGSIISRRVLIAKIALSAVGGLFFILMLVCWWKRERKTQRVVEDFLKNYGTLAPKRYTYHDIKKITSSFNDKVGQALSAVGGLFVILMLICCWKRVQLSTHSEVFLKREEKTQRVVEDFLKNYETLAPKRYTYHDIKKITSSFKDKVGQGGYGAVYKGKLVDGRLVAVKLLDKAKGNGEEFMNEVASISRTSHVNVVSLLGFCFDGSNRALIYEFIPKGSLEKFIYDQNQLKEQPRLEWRTLYHISIGVARGLEYLHRGCSTRILHFDIKPHNILLDKDFTPKISDFGLAKICSRDESIISMLDARGTAGYIAPEVFSRSIGGVSHKSDVYSYGMMVLEIVGRRRNIDVGVDCTSEIYFPHWIYKRLVLDEDLKLHEVMSKEDEEITRKMLLVSLWCIQTSPIDRPTMTKVVEMLEGRLELLSTPPKPYLCSPARDPVSSSNT